MGCDSGHDQLEELKDEENEVQQLVGLTEDEATARAAELGYSVRIIGRDGECFATFSDLIPERVNLSIFDRRVTSAGVG